MNYSNARTKTAPPEKGDSLKKALNNETYDESLNHLITGANAVCFECKAKSLWASVSLGIFLCIVHAGQHRHLGTHLSKVRSLTLDAWDDKQIKFLELGGNERAAKVFANCGDLTLAQKYGSQTAENYRNLLRQEVSDHLGVSLDDETKPIQLDPSLQRFSKATAIGSSDFQPRKKNEKSCCDCCTLL